MTEPSLSCADWVVAARDQTCSDGTEVSLAEPGETGLQALFCIGWTDWTEALRGPGAIVFPVPAGALQNVGERFDSLADLHAAITGDARRPVVLQRSGDATQGRVILWVPPPLSCFAGHFPGHPVVPGVVLIGWAVAEIRSWQPAGTEIREFRQVKFQRVVTPGDTLRISWTRSDAALATYVVESSGGVNARGQCVLGEPR